MTTTRQAGYMSVREFLASLDGRLSKNSVYAAIADGTIPSVRIGRRILLRTDVLDRVLESQTSAGAKRERDGFL